MTHLLLAAPVVGCILLFAAGGCVRDGWPSFKDMTGGILGTHAARIAGAILCGAGAYFVHGAPLAGWICLGILAGFYFDMKHGEGQGADNLASYGYLTLSGLTSLLPLALIMAGGAVFLGPIVFARLDLAVFLPLLALGLLKPPIWGAAWFIRPNRFWSWLQPTRVSAIVFYGCIGAAVALVL